MNGVTRFTNSDPPSDGELKEDKNNYNVEINDIESNSENLIFEKGTQIEAGLKSRHIQIISLAGAIGTGLFVGSGAGLAACGPAGLFVGYMILSVTVWLVMNQLAEMVTFIPVPGKTTIFALCERYTGNKSMAFAAGFNLFYAQALIVPAEITAAAFVIQYWTPINPAAWISIFWVTMCLLNFCAVKYFGEIEFWIGSIKLFAVTGLIIVGIVIFFGGAPNSHGVLGFHYWKNPGAFTEHLTGGNTGKFLACWTGIIKSAFAFILTPELITSCASEAEHPRVNLPKATDRFIYRMIFFYVFGSLTIGVIVAYNDSRLMGAINSGASGAAASPFVIGIQNAGIHVLNHIVNAAILTSAYSCGNAQFFAATRTLHSMAIRKQVPKIFGYTNRNGVPWVAAVLVSAINLLSFLNVSNSSAIVFTWLTNISTVSGFISWIFIGITYLRFRKAIDYHGLNERVTYRKPLGIYGAYFTIFFFTLVSLTNGYAVFFDFNGSDFVAAYITIPIVLILYFGHAIWYKNWRLFAPLDEIDCITGLAGVEKDAAEYVQPVPKNWLHAIWLWLF
ncbi:proline permease [Martiniozyma asiatica (nom. inval.)]|nr:proline permease [Martiniozyma asiatica]